MTEISRGVFSCFHTHNSIFKLVETAYILSYSHPTMLFLACSAYANYKTPTSLTLSYDWVINTCCINPETKEDVSTDQLMNLAAGAKTPSSATNLTHYSSDLEE